MKLKDEHSKVYTGIPDEEIQASLDVVSQVLNSNITVDMSTGDLRKVKNLQVNKTMVNLQNSSGFILYSIMYSPLIKKKYIINSVIIVI